MKGSKPYPHIDEEDGNILTANEPVGTLTYADDVVEMDFNQASGLPTTWDELLECLQTGEEEYERGEGLLWEEEATQRLKTHMRGYGS